MCSDDRNNDESPLFTHFWIGWAVILQTLSVTLVRHTDLFKGRSDIHRGWNWGKLRLDKNYDHIVAGNRSHCSWTGAKLAVSGFICHFTATCTQLDCVSTCSDSRLLEWVETEVHLRASIPAKAALMRFDNTIKAKRIISGFLQETKLFTKCTKYLKHFHKVHWSDESRHSKSYYPFVVNCLILILFIALTENLISSDWNEANGFQHNTHAFNMRISLFFCICINWSSDILLTPSREILLLLATLYWGQRSVSAADSIPRAARGLLSSVNDTSARKMLANTCARTPGTPVKIPRIATNPRKCAFFVYLVIWVISIFKYCELVWSEKNKEKHTVMHQ